MSDESKNEELAEKGPTERVFKFINGSPVSGMVLNRKNALPVLRRQIAICTSKDVFSDPKMVRRGRGTLLIRSTAGRHKERSKRR